MQLIDTHTHLYLPEFDNDRDEVVKNATGSGIIKMLLPNIDSGSIASMIETENKYHGICHAMMGLHPTSVKADYMEQLKKVEEQLSLRRFTAIGEIGIDLYWDKTYIEEQKIAFRHQLRIASVNDLPVAIHSREAFNEIFEILEEFRGTSLTGVFHAFTGNAETAKKAISMGFYLGIGGVVTFKNSGLADAVKEAGVERLVLETDSPYLAPVPHRGRRNESSYICIINRKLAEIFECSVEKTAEVTTQNARDLFKI